VCTDTPHARWIDRTGTASNVKAASQAKDGQQNRYASNGDSDHGRFGMRDALNDGDVEQH
jgi:hypothetical protein